MIATGLPWLEVVGPPEEGEWDKDGCFHTLEWRLKKEGESCRFYQNGRCSVYRDRPMLCRTYPFYLDNGELMCSECRGLGGKIESDEADKMAEQLILRYLFEIQEAIALLERYRDFERGEAKKGGGCIVHDSEGEHRIASGKTHGDKMHLIAIHLKTIILPLGSAQTYSYNKQDNTQGGIYLRIA